MILIRNCPHKNNIFTYLSEDGSHIYKSSRAKNGMNSLRKEFNGYKWYRNRLGLPEKDIHYVESISYLRLEIPFSAGSPADFTKGLESNLNAIKIGFKLYESLWPCNENAAYPIHGDYSLGNILFDKNGSTIIDWEHFTDDAAPWGFDLLNLFYESTYFSFRGNLTLASDEVVAYLSLKKYLNDLLASKNGMNLNYTDFKCMVNKNFNVWGHLYKKLPALMLSHSQVNFLNSLE